MRNIIKLISTLLAMVCINCITIAQVTSVNGSNGTVQINLTLHGDNLSVNGGNSLFLSFGPGNISSITGLSGISGSGSSGVISIDANASSATWNCNQISGKSISTSSPGSNQLLKFNGTQWTPSDDLGSSGGNPLWIENGNDIYMGDGNICIGTTQSDAKLTVKGKIHTEELIVDLNIPGPDYVFSKEYKLMPLEEVEKYIKYNKHLPEIPSAKQMMESNIKLSELTVLILKKTEELTLYIVDHEKRINRQIKTNQHSN